MQKLATIRPDLKVKTCSDANVKDGTCPSCKFDGKLPVKMRGGVIKNFPKGLVVEYRTEVSRTKSKIKEQCHVHCPACGFWDHTSITIEVPIK